MVALLITPEWQFVDADGHPYAGGTVETYIPGTSTSKTTWSNNTGSAANTNPIVLDAAGRCLAFGDGEYRIILRDADGNLVYDQWSTSIVSACMQPVVAAPDLATARRLMGIDEAIAAAVAAEAALRIAADASLQAQITAEIARASAAEANLQSQITTLTNNLADVNRRLTALEAAGGPGSYQETYTTMQQHTEVTIANPSGRPVRIEVVCNPGAWTVVDGPQYDASAKVSRDGVTIGILGYQNSSAPGPTLSPALDHPAAGNNVYAVDFYLDPEIIAASGSSDWSTNFSAGSNCYLFVQLM